MWTLEHSLKNKFRKPGFFPPTGIVCQFRLLDNLSQDESNQFLHINW